jgi:hypothetical protein
MAGHFRAWVGSVGFVAQDDPGDRDLVHKPAAAMIGKAGIVVADDPRPVEAGRQPFEQRPGVGREPLATEPVVEAVAEAVEPSRAGTLDLAREPAQRRVRIIGRQELPETCEPARLFEVQVGDEQRVLRRPEQRAVARGVKRFACERKGNLEAGLTAGRGSC